MQPPAARDPYRLLRQVNLNHLFYFWAVGQAGSVTAAAARLGIAQPGVTSQLQTLEKRIGATLVQRGPRGTVLTSAGQSAMRFAEEIVAICSELVRSLPLQGDEEVRPLVVGTVDSVPKMVVRSVLGPLATAPQPTRLVCREWRIEGLLSELSLHRLDAVITDGPLPSPDGSPFESYSIGSSSIDLYAAASLARKYRRGFPGSIADAPMLLPYQGTSLRISVDRWFTLHRLQPNIALETDDRSLLHYFAESGVGLVPIATNTAAEVARQFQLQRIGSLDHVHEAYYLTTFHRQNEHPALATLRESLASRKKSGPRPRNRTGNGRRRLTP